MFLAFGRMAILLIVVLTVVYVCLYFYWRAGVKMRLEEDWVQEGRPGDRDEWVDGRIAPHAARIRRWLVAFVYVLPLVGLSVFIYVTN
jgi:hypothetical protein